MSLRPNIIKTFITYNNKQYYIPSVCSFSQSNTWETVEKRSTDNSNSVQNISILQKYGRQPNSYSITFNFIPSLEQKNLWDLVSEYELLVGKSVNFTYSGYTFRGLIITDGSFTVDNDLVRGSTKLSISYNLKESIVITPAAPSNIRLI